MVSGRVLAGGLAIAAIGVAGLVWSFWNRGVTVVLRNTDSATLSGVVVHVTGGDSAVGDMPAGSTRRILVEPTGESHIEISQQVADARGRIPVSCYFEAGSSGEIEIHLSRTSAAVVDNRITVGLW
jgi:hypothetical protein